MRRVKVWISDEVSESVAGNVRDDSLSVGGGRLLDPKPGFHEPAKQSEWYPRSLTRRVASYFR